MRLLCRFLPLVVCFLMTCSASATRITIGDPPVLVNPITDADIPFSVTFGTCTGLPGYSADRGCYAFYNESSSAWSSITLTLTKGTPSNNIFTCDSPTYQSTRCSYDPSTGQAVLLFTNGSIPNNTLQTFVIAEDDLDPSALAFTADVTFATSTVTPEPSAIVLLATGLLCGGTMLWTRRRTLV